MLKTPVLFLFFNRPETTMRVFHEIQKAKPSKLFLAGDGPRKEVKNEMEICTTLKEKLLNKIDWDCEVTTLFRDHNLGCKKAVSGAIDWFFEHVEQGIILEDDCLPDPSFFPYCELMLERYNQVERVMHVAGVNFQGTQRGEGSYYFSKYPHIWGWATWKRAWNHYDVNISTWPQLKKSKAYKSYFVNKLEFIFWKNIFDRCFRGEIDTWDFQWVFAIFKERGLCIMPNTNLVSNIGFGAQATHTHNENDAQANNSVKSYLLPDVETKVVAHEQADLFTIQNVFNYKGGLLHNRVINKVKRLLKKI